MLLTLNESTSCKDVWGESKVLASLTLVSYLLLVKCLTEKAKNLYPDINLTASSMCIHTWFVFLKKLSDFKATLHKMAFSF